MIRKPHTTRGSEQSVEEFADCETLLVFAHQDDDLLWMLPFWPVARLFLLAAYPAAPVFESLVQSFSPELKYRERWRPIWNAVDNDTWVSIFTDRRRRAEIITVEAIKARLRPYLSPAAKRIVTHNNWGEYGHAQHLLVNAAVRELAVDVGLDVWALGTRVPPSAGDPAQYRDVAHDFGLPVIEGYFDPAVFQSLRSIYLSASTRASTPALTATFQKWSSTLWTWSTQPDAYPTGWRPFVKLVSQGVDLTIDNPAIHRLVQEVGIVNE